MNTPLQRKMRSLVPTQFNCVQDLRPILGQPGFFIVVNPMFVFKKVYQYPNPTTHLRKQCIANLIIPDGAVVFLGTRPSNYIDVPSRPNTHISHTYTGKLRASEAYVHSIVRLKRSMAVDKGVKTAYSWHNPSFKYAAGHTVTPKGAFSFTPEECEAGIHFFLNVDEAWSY